MKFKLLWLYMLDDCDHAGVWHTDFEIASIRIGAEVTKEEALEVFKDKIVTFDEGEKWFFPSFIEFQYGQLNNSNRLHGSVIKILDKYGLTETLKGLPRPLYGPTKGPMDKDKEQDKDKEKEKDKEEYKGEVKEIVKYLNHVTGSTYRVSGSKTRDLIKARIREGFKVNDFKVVITKKFKEWTGTEWQKFLRPETLFSNKFEGYVNQPESNGKMDSGIDRFNKAQKEEDDEENGTDPSFNIY